MKVLVLNCGSSSIKYKLFEMTTKEVLAQGGIEKIGLPGSFLKLTLPNGEKKILEKYNPQIQISAESGTKRSIFRQKNKTKRSKKRLHTTLIKPEQKVNEDLCSGFIVS